MRKRPGFPAAGGLRPTDFPKVTRNASHFVGLLRIAGLEDDGPPR